MLNYDQAVHLSALLASLEQTNLVVISLGNNLLASRSEHNGMLILSRVASLDVAEGWVGLDDANIAEIFQCTHVLLLLPIAAVDGEGATILSFQPASAEGQGTKRLIDMTQEFLSARQTERNVRSVEVFHVMRAFHVFHNVSSASSVF